MFYNTLREAVSLVDPDRLMDYRLARQLALLRDDYRCRICGRRDGLEVHHVVFRSRGGDHRLRNLITLCWPHHDWIEQNWIRITTQAVSWTVEYRRRDGTVRETVHVPFQKLP